MNRSRSLTYLLSSLLIVSLVSTQAETTVLKAKPGSHVQIDGTSNVHDWTVQGSLIGGTATVGDGFPLTAGATVKPGVIEAAVKAFIPVTSLKSVKDGKPYSTKMDAIMYEKLGKPDHKFINYWLEELTLKEAPSAPGNPYVFDSKGYLVVAGVTNAVELPVEVSPLDDGRVKFATAVEVKMSNFKIDPPAPKIAFGLIKTGDDVKIKIEWMTAPATK